MRCLSPRTVGFEADGKTISWSQKKYSKEFATFQLPCGKCIECRLEYARQWAIRCVHEAAMYEKNAFITLTYDDQHLGDNKLDYRDFQLFMKKLRKTQNDPIGVFVTGEYGEKSKRKHWHAILFNWQPGDLSYKRSNERSDKIYNSGILTLLWGKGATEVGSVTMESAGYCARYAAKKLVHGTDGSHDYEPISRKSSKNAIGKRWIEKFWPDVFNYGHIILPDGNKTAIPRYYEKWLKQHQPDAWIKYVTKLKNDRMVAATARQEQERLAYRERDSQRPLKLPETTRLQARTKIIKQKFNQLQKMLKL